MIEELKKLETDARTEVGVCTDSKHLEDLNWRLTL